MSKLQESVRTTVPEDDLPELNLDEQSFEAELERCYLDKLRQERAKVEQLTKDYEEVRQQLQQKQFLLKSQERKLQFLGEQASYKPKFEENHQRLRQTEAQLDSLSKECEDLRNELTECIQERNTLLKEMKECMRDTDFKLSEQHYEMQEAIGQKDKLIDQLKQRNNELVRKAQQETFRKDVATRLQSECSVDKQRQLVDEIQRLEKLLSKRQEENAQLTDQLESLQLRSDNLQQQLLNKEDEMDVQANSHHKLLQKMKFHLRQLRNELADKEQLIAQQKENLEKANDTVRKTELKLLTTTEELKLQERNHNDMLQRANFDWGQDKQSFLETTRGLKANVSDLIRVKSQLLYENDKLHAVAKHRQSTDKVRSGIAAKQYCEIDKIGRMLLRK